MITLVGQNALGFYDDGSIANLTHLWREDVLSHTLNLMGKKTYNPHKKVPVVKERTVSFVNIWSNNYFHAVLECFASLVMMDPDSYDVILIKDNAPDYIIEGLELLQLDDKVRKWTGQDAKYENLISPEKVRCDGYSYPDALKELRARLMEKSEIVNGKIFISRLDAHTRRIEPEKENALNRDFTHVQLSGRSLKSQILLFASAKEIAGLHGAGLTNMVWCPDGCSVTEYVTDYKNPCFLKLAQVLGFSYGMVGL